MGQCDMLNVKTFFRLRYSEIITENPKLFFGLKFVNNFSNKFLNLCTVSIHLIKHFVFCFVVCLLKSGM